MNKSPTPRWFSRFRELVLEFLPAQLKRIVERGLLSGLVSIVGIIFLAPLAMLLLASIWLNQVKQLDYPVTKSLREWYLETVNEGLSIEEVSARSHARLDYLQVFEYDLYPNKGSARREIRISIQPWQRAEIDFRRIQMVPNKRECSLPENPFQLVNISLGDADIRSVSAQQVNEVIEINEEWWGDNAKKLVGKNQVHTLLFSLTEKANTLACGHVRIEGNVRVYKILFKKAGK